MRRFRIFVAELIGLGLLLGWLMWKYPELVDDIIPWIALLIAWHVTWEYVLDTKPVKRLSARVSKRLNPMIAWPLVFLLGGALSLLYWRGISASLQRLSSIQAARALRHAELSPSPTPNVPTESRGKLDNTEDPAPNNKRAPESNLHVHVPPLKSSPSELPSIIGPRLGSGPEAYKDVGDPQVGQWAIEEADKIEEMAKKSMQEGRGMSAQSTMWRFTTAFRQCCEQDLKDLRTELLRRLGPPSKDSDEISTWGVIFPERKYSSMEDLISPATVVQYAPYLRRMGERLRRRSRPKEEPLMLHYSQQKVDSGRQDFPYGTLVTITPLKTISYGYVAVVLEGPVAIVGDDLGRPANVFFPRDVDNKELAKFLVDNQGHSYVVKIIDTAITPARPLHIRILGTEKVGIASATFFDE